MEFLSRLRYNSNSKSSLGRALCVKPYVLFCALCSLFFALSSCTDDLGFRADDVTDENFTGITFFIPDVNGAAEFGATRSDGYANTRAYDQAKEGSFNTLYIIAIEKKDDGTEHVQTVLKNQYDAIVDNYRKYSISLPEGNYRFYIVSNMNRYLTNDNNESLTIPSVVTNEATARSLILNFSSDRPLEPGFLPMACLHENMKVGESLATATNVGDDNIRITKNSSQKIYADMNFLCAKVRYTILFDRSKSSFGTGDVIDIHRHIADDNPYATFLRRKTVVSRASDAPAEIISFITEGSGEEISPSSWPIFLDRYVYDDAFDFYNAPNETDEEKLAIQTAIGNLEPWSEESNGAWTSESFLAKRAWQGVAYLPENLLSQGNNQATLLKFPYSFNGATGVEGSKTMTLDFEHADESIGLRRAMSYDIYAVIKNPDPASWTLTVIPQPWTLQELTYQLHGPYELIVESSTIKNLSMQEEATFWYRSDVPPEEIGFSSPYVLANGKYMDLFVGGVMKDEKGNYVKNEKGDYMFRVGFNLDIPYSILNKIRKEGGYEYTGSDFNKQKYDIKDISFFHIVAGSLYKRIEIEKLDLNPYLVVTPQTIIVDTRELYTSGYNNYNDTIFFKTNVDINSDMEVSFKLTDKSKLIADGKGDGALKISDPAKYLSGKEAPYDINNKTGYIVLNIRDIIEGNPYWDKNNEYTLTFTLTLPDETEPLEQTVTIKIRPFSGNYIIHFKDNTKDWENPHIYIYQDLTLPADMMTVDPNGKKEPYKYAGKIVGFVEENPSSGLQWNAALQYVFTNNMSFRGWYGNNVANIDASGNITPIDENFYGGPELNDPWEEATVIYKNPSSTGDTPGNSPKPDTTMGFVMFGEPYQKNGRDSRAGTNFWFWNYKYAYNVTGLLQINDDRYQRYNYDVNFNVDHEAGYADWGCYECVGLMPNYNNGGGDGGNIKDRFYPGISMQREYDEHEGWWTYTLTGVAQPGRTMVIFANWHKPWNESERDYRAEDYRWPGDYEAGLPLFDFEDNEAWFLFDGNTSNSDQKFEDNKPVERELPLYFNEDMIKDLRVKVDVPSGMTVSKVSVGHKNKFRAGEPSTTIDQNDLRLSSDNYITLTNYTQLLKYKNLVVRLYTDNTNYKEYELAPKNFVKSGTGYVSAHPIYLAFKEDIMLYVKWNDKVNLDESWGGIYSYYTPPAGGSNWVGVYWDNNRGTKMDVYPMKGKEYGNYKHSIFNFKSNPGNFNTVSLRLCTDANGTGAFHQNLKVEDLPKYYYPAGKYYLINWHLFGRPND